MFKKQLKALSKGTNRFLKVMKIKGRNTKMKEAVEQQLQELTQQSSNTERSNDILDEEFVDVVRKCVAFVGENKDCLKDLMIKPEKLDVPQICKGIAVALKENENKMNELKLTVSKSGEKTTQLEANLELERSKKAELQAALDQRESELQVQKNLVESLKHNQELQCQSQLSGTGLECNVQAKQKKIDEHLTKQIADLVEIRRTDEQRFQSEIKALKDSYKQLIAQFANQDAELQQRLEAKMAQMVQLQEQYDNMERDYLDKAKMLSDGRNSIRSEEMHMLRTRQKEELLELYEKINMKGDQIMNRQNDIFELKRQISIAISGFRHNLARTANIALFCENIGNMVSYKNRI